MIRIGLVDDDLEHLRLIREYLSRYEREEDTAFQIEEFHNGLNFVEDYNGQLDIVFLDIEMPHMDGMTAARKIREQDASLAIISYNKICRRFKVGLLSSLGIPAGYEMPVVQ